MQLRSLKSLIHQLFLNQIWRFLIYNNWHLLKYVGKPYELLLQFQVDDFSIIKPGKGVVIGFNKNLFQVRLRWWMKSYKYNRPRVFVKTWYYIKSVSLCQTKLQLLCSMALITRSVWMSRDIIHCVKVLSHLYTNHTTNVNSFTAWSKMHCSHTCCSKL